MLAGKLFSLGRVGLELCISGLTLVGADVI